MKRRQLLALLGAGLGEAQAQPSSTAVIKTLERAARAEGLLQTVGMPDHWANWRSTWADLKRLYGIAHLDTDMNSADEVALMQAQGPEAKIDLGDIGFEYAALARGRGVSLPHKPAVWDRLPSWSKDADGFWALAYTGTIAFAVNKRRVGARVPRSWRELFKGNYLIQIGVVGASAQANAAVLAAAIALGGAENRLQNALVQFARVAREGRLRTVNPGIEPLRRGDADVFVLWDFNALAYADLVARNAEYEVLIPEDGSLMSGYTPIINKYAPHPNAAQLAHEYIFSDAGQTNLARGFARPIRVDQLDLPTAVRTRLIDARQYRNARTVQPMLWAWEVRSLPRTWAAQVGPIGAASKPLS